MGRRKEEEKGREREGKEGEGERGVCDCCMQYCIHLEGIFG